MFGRIHGDRTKRHRGNWSRAVRAIRGHSCARDIEIRVFGKLMYFGERCTTKGAAPSSPRHFS
jgi:hypothetical protein